MSLAVATDETRKPEDGRRRVRRAGNLPREKDASRSVLVVEDDTAIRGTIVEALATEGYAVRSSENGSEALALLRAGHRPDAIVLDLMMPVMDGWSFRVEQKRDPTIASIPVIALSADGSSKAAAVDAEAYLKKPFAHEALVAAVERVMLRLQRRELDSHLAETERLASLGTLAAGVAHEINNPLTYTLMNLEHVQRQLRAMSAREGKDHELAPLIEALARSIDGATRVANIVRGIRTFSRGNVERRELVEVRASSSPRSR